MDYLDLITRVFQTDIDMFASEAGQMYSVIFTSMPSLSTRFQKSLKKFFLTLKQNDGYDENGRSIFYCLLLKILTYISHMEDEEVLRILSTTIDSVAELPELKDQQINIDPIKIGKLVIS